MTVSRIDDAPPAYKSRWWYLCAGIVALMGQSALADESFNPNAQEMAMLPPYCKEKIEKKDPALNQSWANRFGKEYWLHLHHYCYGLNFINRAHRSLGDKQARNHHLKNAENNIQYMLDRSEGFFLRPEILTQMGKVQQELDRPAEAANYFQKAIGEAPDYAPAYAALADFYVKLGEREKAVELLTKGLEHVPNAASLQRRLKELKR